jgi:hypothetical protein
VRSDCGTYIWVSMKLPLQCAVVSLYSAVKQRLKCNTGKLCDCLIQCLLTVVGGHHYQHLLQVHSDFPNALYYINAVDPGGSSVCSRLIAGSNRNADMEIRLLC